MRFGKGPGAPKGSERRESAPASVVLTLEEELEPGSGEYRARTNTGKVTTIQITNPDAVVGNGAVVFRQTGVHKRKGNQFVVEGVVETYIHNTATSGDFSDITQNEFTVSLRKTIDRIGDTVNPKKIRKESLSSLRKTLTRIGDVEKPRAGQVEEEDPEKIIEESLRTIAASDPKHEGLALHKLPRFAVGVVMEGGADDDQQSYIQIDQSRGYSLPQRIPHTTMIAPDTIVLLTPDIGPNGDVVWTVDRPLGSAHDRDAAILSLAYRAGSSPEFPESVEREAHILEREIEEMGEAAFMERELHRSHFEYPGGPKAREVRLVGELKDYVHGETRLDLRYVPGMQICGIDPEDARDHDDIVSYQEFAEDTTEIRPDGRTVGLPKGTIRVGVHIANVDQFAYPGTALDREANARQMTMYLPGLTVPVYPEILSANLCSLKPNTDRIASSVIFTFYPDGRISTWHGDTVVRSQKQFSYKAADRVLEDSAHPFNKAFTELKRIGDKYRLRREERGAIIFPEEPEMRMVADKNGRLRMQPVERAITSKMIEDWMLRANSAVGAILVKDEKEPGENVVLERVHTPPPLDRIMRLLNEMYEFDLKRSARTNGKTPPNRQTQDYISKYQQAMRYPEGNARREELLAELNNERNDMVNHINERSTLTVSDKAIGFARKMKDGLRRISPPARYAIERGIGHAGLATIPYVHFTSPIRRRPDVLTKRLRDHKISFGPVTYDNEVAIAELESEVARANLMDSLITQAERDARDIVALHDLADTPIGTEFNAVKIEGYAPKGRGVFAAVPIPGKYTYRFMIPWEIFSGAADSDALYGTFRPGTEISLILQGVDFAQRQANFAYNGSTVRRRPAPQRPRRNPRR